MNRRRVLGLAAGALSMPQLLRPALANSYPDRPIRLIVPYPPGGGTDTWARLVTEGMQPELGQTIVIENRGGASGMVGAEVVARAAPDGYTLLFHITTHVQAPVVLRRFPYDPINDFSFIGRLGTTAITFCIGRSVPAEIRTLEQFIEWGRSREVAIGNYGPGSTGHAFGLLLAKEANLRATQVAYRGEAPMLQDLLAGSFHGGFHSTIVAGEMMKAGRLRPLATGGPDRVPSLANRVPTLLELGYSQRFNFSGFNGLLAPARLPREVMERLVTTFRKVATSPDTLRRLHEIDTIPGYEDPDTFKASAERTLHHWRELAEALDLYASA